ncbi:MAG: phytanoyl-CoA dioxygenase family protein [Armatimonadetes bacterium]|nr:phytanoyl-CoA dioxygenase family protein [Armatimonadota bacterium]
MAARAFALSDDLQHRFNEEGYIVLKGFLDPKDIRDARSAMEGLVDREAEKLMAAGKSEGPLHGEPLETRLLRLYENHMEEIPILFRPELHQEGLFDLFFHPGLLDIAEAILGGEIRLYPNYSARPKLPDNARTEVLWHQDGGYTGGEAGDLRMVNVWTPLVPARRENGCMEFIPGTHRLGLVPHEGREYYLEIASEYLLPRKKDAVAIEIDPQDIVLFHNLLFHRGLPNRSAKIRWNLDWRYQDATQPTLRPQQGHIARSRLHPESVVRDARQWAALSFE